MQKNGFLSRIWYRWILSGSLFLHLFLRFWTVQLSMRFCIFAYKKTFSDLSWLSASLHIHSLSTIEPDLDQIWKECFVGPSSLHLILKWSLPVWSGTDSLVLMLANSITAFAFLFFAFKSYFCWSVPRNAWCARSRLYWIYFRILIRNHAFKLCFLISEIFNITKIFWLLLKRTLMIELERN